MTTIVKMRDRPDLLTRLERDGEHSGLSHIDRRTRRGNRFRIGEHGSRAEVIALPPGPVVANPVGLCLPR